MEPRSDECFNEETNPVPVPPPPPSPFVPVVPVELATPPDPQAADTCSDSELSPAPEGNAPHFATAGPLADRRDSLTPPLSDDFSVPVSEQTSSSASSGPRRSSRSTRRPAYLSDYVT